MVRLPGGIGGLGHLAMCRQGCQTRDGVKRVDGLECACTDNVT